MYKKCLICEKEIENWNGKDSEHYSYMGGSMRCDFGFGSRYDWMGLRTPARNPQDSILKDRPGYRAVDSGLVCGDTPTGTTIYIPDITANIESVPCSGIPQDKKDLVVASKNKIMTYICDDCFEKKIEFFEGIEVPWKP